MAVATDQLDCGELLMIAFVPVYVQSPLRTQGSSIYFLPSLYPLETFKIYMYWAKLALIGQVTRGRRFARVVVFGQRR